MRGDLSEGFEEDQAGAKCPGYFYWEEAEDMANHSRGLKHRIALTIGQLMALDERLDGKGASVGSYNLAITIMGSAQGIVLAILRDLIEAGYRKPPKV